MGPDCFTLNECSRWGASHPPAPRGPPLLLFSPPTASPCYRFKHLQTVSKKSPTIKSAAFLKKKKKKFQIFWKYSHLMTKQKHFSYNSQILPQRKSINPQSDTKMIQIPPTHLWLINGETKVIGLNERCQASQRWCSLHGGLWSLKGGGMCNI